VVAAIFIMFGSSSLESELIYKVLQLVPPNVNTHNHGWRPLGEGWHYFVRGWALENAPQRRQYRTNESGVKIHQT
jgi:hypothetical protein